MLPIGDFGVNSHIPNATDATNQVIFIAPFDCQIVSVTSRHRVASSSGTHDIVKATSGTALASGVSLLSAAMSSAGTANTNVAGALKTGAGDLQIPKGSAIGIVFGGTLTNLVDLDITVILRQTRLS